ncbi:MAG TPA: hypothetical protein DCZ95_18585 [Verrucomicrobia bacterium]|nr:MAG: hypothetical protein A2X46_14945 [Lentisphaerae bacterium GWF2_57_35]HBA86096.1 hypothetical protein [Verrucomicrobiota bacterium]
MRLIEAHARLLKLGQPVFTTTDAAACLEIPAGHASKMLARLAETEHVASLMRGLWAFPDKVSPLALPAYLTAPFPAYVSLQSALYYHGMISQIPSVTYAISIARTRLYRTSLGAVSVHHVEPPFFFGFEQSQEHIWMATPEKALLDVLYLSPAKSRLFAALPELEFPKSFSPRRARQLAKKIPSPRRKTLVQSRLERLLP